MRAARAGHADHATFEVQVRKLGLKIGAVRSTCTRHAHIHTRLAEFHVACLRHETVNHTVKDHIVVGPFGRQRSDLLDVLGCHIFEQVDDDGSVGFACDVNLKPCGTRRHRQ